MYIYYVLLFSSVSKIKCDKLTHKKLMLFCCMCHVYTLTQHLYLTLWFFLFFPFVYFITVSLKNYARKVIKAFIKSHLISFSYQWMTQLELVTDIIYYILSINHKEEIERRLWLGKSLKALISDHSFFHQSHYPTPFVGGI
jgi:energy-coupling factor transporter transmembrane protein EcfT